MPSKTKEELASKLCNLCGECCHIKKSDESRHPFEKGYAELSVLNVNIMGGYDSTPYNGDGALDDMSEYHFSLCEFCIDHLMQNMKIPPTVICRIDNKEEKFVPAKERIKNSEMTSQNSLEEIEKRDVARKIW